jgi:hypothetical protein
MDNDKKHEEAEVINEENDENEVLNRRDFLVGLKKWSKAVVGGTIVAATMANAKKAGAWRPPIPPLPRWLNGGGIWKNGGVVWANGGHRWGNGRHGWHNHGRRWKNHGGRWHNRGGRWHNAGWNNRPKWSNWNNRPGWYNGPGWKNRGPRWVNRGPGWINRGPGWFNRP